MAQYIDKSALVSEIERLKDEYLRHSRNKFCAEWSCGTLDNILSFINTLEVKEVDLAKEVANWKIDHQVYGMDEMFYDIAKHFFELGLSVNNPITAADRGWAEEVIINLKRVEQDYRISLTKEIEWVRNKVKKGE